MPSLDGMLRLTPPGFPKRLAEDIVRTHLRCPVCGVHDAEALPRVLAHTRKVLRAECQLCGSRFAYDSHKLLMSVLLSESPADEHRYATHKLLIEVPEHDEIDDRRLRMALDAEHLRRHGKLPPSLDGIDWDRVEAAFGRPGMATHRARLGLRIATGEYDETELADHLADLRRRYPA